MEGTPIVEGAAGGRANGQGVDFGTHGIGTGLPRHPTWLPQGRLMGLVFMPGPLLRTGQAFALTGPWAYRSQILISSQSVLPERKGGLR